MMSDHDTRSVAQASALLNLSNHHAVSTIVKIAERWEREGSMSSHEAWLEVLQALELYAEQTKDDYAVIAAHQREAEAAHREKVGR